MEILFVINVSKLFLKMLLKNTVYDIAQNVNLIYVLIVEDKIQKKFKWIILLDIHNRILTKMKKYVIKMKMKIQNSKIIIIIKNRLIKKNKNSSQI